MKRSNWFPAVVDTFIVLVAVGVIWTIVAEILEPDSGRIYSREYQSGWSESYCSTYNKDGTCAQHSSRWHSECYQVKYHNEAEDADGDACVAPQDWNKYQVGTQYP